MLSPKDRCPGCKTRLTVHNAAVLEDRITCVSCAAKHAAVVLMGPVRNAHLDEQAWEIVRWNRAREGARA